MSEADSETLYLVCIVWGAWTHPYKVIAFFDKLDTAKQHVEDTENEEMRKYHWENNRAFSMIVEVDRTKMDNFTSFNTPKMYLRPQGSLEWKEL